MNIHLAKQELCDHLVMLHHFSHSKVKDSLAALAI